MGIFGELQIVTAIAATTSYTLIHFKPEVLLVSKPAFLGTFAKLWLLGFLAWAFWKVILYPKYLSPLRHLPSPPVRILEHLSCSNGSLSNMRNGRAEAFSTDNSS